ncbi:MAG TPA: hypothetical protein VM142_08135 [Acidimicrobiales bacterium]|nr:hypothetical protein [Acidimicrobiales bacterium]
MSVTLLSSPAELPADPPPELFVLVQDEPAEGAGTIAELLHAGPPCTPAEATARLNQPDAETPVAGGAKEDVDEAATLEALAEDADEASARAALREAALDQARERAAEALARVPTRARTVAVERLHNAAAAIHAAEEAALDARTVLGERPELPADAAQAAIAAEEAVHRAHQRRTTGIDRSCTLLLGANAVGILIVAGRIRTPAVEPLFVLVAAIPLTALLHLMATFASNTWQARAAAQSRRAALRSTGMATMTGLTARNARVKAWTARADTLAAAEASLAHARRRWATLTGASAGPAQIDALLRIVAEAHRAAAALEELEAQTAESVPGLDPDRAPAPDTEPGPEPLPGLAPPLDRLRPIVVFMEGAAHHPLDDETRVLLEGWDEEGIPCPLVVVTACSEVGAWAEARTAGVGAKVVDLRERVLASLDRLRARTTSFGDPSPPESIAADG